MKRSVLLTVLVLLLACACLASAEPEKINLIMIGGDGDVKVGNPVLAGAKVEGKVLGQVKGQKIIVYKYKSKKNYARKAGHRQPYTKVEITAINA